jgi:hypothetical protein
MVLEASLMAVLSGDAVAAESLAGHAIRLARGEGHDDAKSGTIGYARVVRGQARRVRGNVPGALEEFQRGVVPLTNGYGSGHPWSLQAKALADSLFRISRRGVASRSPLTPPVVSDGAAAEPSANRVGPSAPKPP